MIKLKDHDNYYIEVDIEFAREYGVNEAMMAGKLLRLQKYLTGRVDEHGAKWIRLTLEEWEREVPMGRRTIQRTIKQLEEKGIFLKRTFAGRSLWYRLNPTYVGGQNSDMPKMASPSGQNGHMQVDKMASPSGQNGQLPKSFPNSSLVSSFTQNGDYDNLPEAVKTQITAEANDDDWQLLRGGLKRRKYDLEQPFGSGTRLNDIRARYRKMVPPPGETKAEWIAHLFGVLDDKPGEVRWSYIMSIMDALIKAGSLAAHRQSFKDKYGRKQNGRNGNGNKSGWTNGDGFDAEAEKNRRNNAKLGSYNPFTGERTPAG